MHAKKGIGWTNFEVDITRTREGGIRFECVCDWVWISKIVLCINVASRGSPCVDDVYVLLRCNNVGDRVWKCYSVNVCEEELFSIGLGEKKYYFIEAWKDLGGLVVDGDSVWIGTCKAEIFKMQFNIWEIQKCH